MQTARTTMSTIPTRFPVPVVWGRAQTPQLWALALVLLSGLGAAQSSVMVTHQTVKPVGREVAIARRDGKGDWRTSS